jgi:hypothetical protein
MTAVAQRMRALRDRRRARGLREVRLVVPDMRSTEVRDRIAQQSAKLDPNDEEEALAWIESVSIFHQGESDDER